MAAFGLLVEDVTRKDTIVRLAREEADFNQNGVDDKTGPAVLINVRSGLELHPRRNRPQAVAGIGKSIVVIHHPVPFVILDHQLRVFLDVGFQPADERQHERILFGIRLALPQ